MQVGDSLSTRCQVWSWWPIERCWIWKRYPVAALSREPPAYAKSLLETLTNYDLTQLDTARVGKAAPDFVLTSARGETYRLSQFRGDKIVVLEFSTATS